MAEFTLKNAGLRLVYDDGLTLDGKPKRKSKTYNGIANDATAEQVLQAVMALSGLSSKSLIEAEKQIVNDIS